MAGNSDHGSIPRSAFATRAQARLLDALGWQIAASPRRETPTHAPLQCCFVLMDGNRDEAAFGYTGLTMPEETDCTTLQQSQIRVERFLAQLDEDRGLLIQNTPLLAFNTPRQDRVAVFGGWRFRHGTWTPFLFGPNGLAGVDDQDLLFSSGTAPHHMAEAFGHEAQEVMPRVAALTGAVEALDQRKAGIEANSRFEPTRGELEMEPSAGGWFTARIAAPKTQPRGEPQRPSTTTAPLAEPDSQKTAPATTAAVSDAFTADEFRFRETAGSRK